MSKIPLRIPLPGIASAKATYTGLVAAQPAGHGCCSSCCVATQRLRVGVPPAEPGQGHRHRRRRKARVPQARAACATTGCFTQVWAPARLVLKRVTTPRSGCRSLKTAHPDKGGDAAVFVQARCRHAQCQCEEGQRGHGGSAVSLTPPALQRRDSRLRPPHSCLTPSRRYFKTWSVATVSTGTGGTGASWRARVTAPVLTLSVRHTNSREKPATAEGPASQSVESQPQEICEGTADGGDAAAVAAAVLRAEAGVATGDSATAAEAYTEALRLSPHDAALLMGRSACYQRLGRLEEALADAQQAVLSRPRLASGHAALGAVLRLLGRHDDEVAALRRAVELDTKRAMVRCCCCPQHFHPLMS